jgi:hypothetical protein
MKKHGAWSMEHGAMGIEKHLKLQYLLGVI